MSNKLRLNTVVTSTLYLEYERYIRVNESDWKTRLLPTGMNVTGSEYATRAGAAELVALHAKLVLNTAVTDEVSIQLVFEPTFPIVNVPAVTLV